jgi:hypothetical protein
VRPTLIYKGRQRYSNAQKDMTKVTINLEKRMLTGQKPGTPRLAFETWGFQAQGSQFSRKRTRTPILVKRQKPSNFA